MHHLVFGINFQIHFLLPTGLPHDNGTGPDLSCSFLVSHFKFLFIPCGRLSWLPVSFLLHVKYTLSYPVVCGMRISASAHYDPHLRASDSRTVRVRKCTATASPRIDRVSNCTVTVVLISRGLRPHTVPVIKSAKNLRITARSASGPVRSPH